MFDVDVKKRGRSKRGRCWHWLADLVVATLGLDVHVNCVVSHSNSNYSQHLYLGFGFECLVCFGFGCLVCFGFECLGCFMDICSSAVMVVSRCVVNCFVFMESIRRALSCFGFECSGLLQLRGGWLFDMHLFLMSELRGE